MSRCATSYDLDSLAAMLTRSSLIDDSTLRRIRVDGGDWPQDGAETMIGDRKLLHLRELIVRAIAAGAEGDLIECGVWRGGACIYMRAVLEALRCTDRQAWVADSFQGCPPGDEHSEFKCLSVSEREVRGNFERYGFLDSQVGFIPGFFAESLPGPVEQLAILRVDCDMYSSTLTVLERLYPLVSTGGFVILDDYPQVAGARRAVDEFRTRVQFRLELDECVAYFQKESN